MKRQEFLKNILGLSTGAAVVAGSVSMVGCKDYTRAEYDENKKAGWENWSGLQTCNPKEILAPRNEQELSEIITKSDKVRFVGSGHSFMPLVPTDHVLVSLDAMSVVVSHDQAAKTATIQSGIKLSSLTRALAKVNQGIISMPDVDYQSWGGATATGTHGTGKDLSALHAYIKSLKLVTAEGELIECDENNNADYFQAAKVSLGSLGAITECTIQNRDLYKLHRKVYFKPLEYVLENGDKFFEENNNFELYYLPHSAYCLLISHNEYEGELETRAASEDEDGLKDLKMARDYLAASPMIRKWVLGLFIDEEKLVEDYKDEYYKLVSQPRVTKFNESEYHIPKENGLECFGKICKKMDTMKENYFPIEFRVIKQDDAWLSPFYKRDCHSIAIHADAKESYEYLISEFGPIFKEYDGRPHWGKLNDVTAKEFAKLYPKWDDFLEVRAKCDPKGKLLNDYLKKIMIG